jgi:hypothetical protein
MVDPGSTAPGGPGRTGLNRLPRLFKTLAQQGFRSAARRAVRRNIFLPAGFQKLSSRKFKRLHEIESRRRFT